MQQREKEALTIINSLLVFAFFFNKSLIMHIIIH